jgi:hypothetical protein
MMMITMLGKVQVLRWEVPPVNVPIHLPVVPVVPACAAAGDGLFVLSALACTQYNALERAQWIAGANVSNLATPSDTTPKLGPAREHVGLQRD